MNFEGVDPDAQLPDPDSLRAALVYDIMACLSACDRADTMGLKGKHEHEYDMPDLTGLQGEGESQSQGCCWWWPSGCATGS